MDDAPVKVGMKPSPPGEFIREEILNELGLSVARAAEVLGVRRATLSDLVNGNAALSPEMALRIEKAFGISMDTLLHMQAWHDGHTMRQRAGEIDVKRFAEHPEPDPSAIKTLAFKGPEVRMLNDLTLHLADLEFCRRVLDHNAAILIGSACDLKTALWTAVFAKFISCFQNSASRRLLHENAVFAGNPDAKSTFEHLKNIRNKFLVHDENSMQQANAVIQLANDGTHRRVFYLRAGVLIDETSFGPTIFDAMKLALDCSLAYIADQIGSLKQRLEAKVAAMSREELDRLDEWQLDAHAAMFETGKNRVRID